jgi:hypothetical protein
MHKPIALTTTHFFFVTSLQHSAGWRDREEAESLLLHNTKAVALETSLQWFNVQATLLDICIAFYPLELPSYIMLEIVDRFPFWSTHVNRKKKIDYIIQIKTFCDDLIASRSKQ